MEALIESMLGRDENFILEKLQSLIKSEETVKDQRKEMEILYSDLENYREDNHYLKNKLDNKRDIIDDMEVELDRFETNFKDAKKAVVLKEIEIDDLERCVAQQLQEISVLKENNDSMVNQISENIQMEKKISIQNGIINELRLKLDTVRDVNETEFTKERDEEMKSLEREVLKLASEVKELELENKDKISRLDCLQTENETLKEGIKTGQDNDCAEKASHGGLSFSEELNLIRNLENKFQCCLCGKMFSERDELKNHLRTNHVEKEDSEKNTLTEHLSMLETRILNEKFTLYSKLLELKEREETFICTCKNFCRIRHKFYNWNKPMSAEFLKRCRNNLGEIGPVDHQTPVEHEVIRFQCHGCKNEFQSLGDLETHSQTLHSEEVLEVCSSNPWGLTFFDI